MSENEEDLVYCLCKKPYDDTIFMIECDICKDWFHGNCVDIEERQAGDIDIYHCPSCQITHGPLKLKRKRSRKRHIAEYSDSLDDLHDVKCGTVSFAKALKQRKFPSKAVRKLKGHILDRDYIEENGFTHPILVKDPAGLDLKVPSSDFTVDDVELAVGSMREVDVIDVAKQSDMRMLMREFVEYYNSPRKERILNVISLEFSNTKLSDLVVPPRIVSELSWVSNYWPESTGDVRTFIKPEVQKYCLMSVKDSYTDFHIDFGGTSVWYHVIKGKKMFYLIEPTDTNLALYETWSSSSDQNNIFFGDQVKACYQVTITPGNTLFIPTGWIHSVYTPEDSLVFGGNFVHSYNISLQLGVYEMERRLGTPDKFSFPNMETLHWYAAKNLSYSLQEALDGGKVPCKYVLDGCTALKNRLHSWMEEKDQNVKRHKEYIPEGISHIKLVKEFAYLISQITSKLSPTRSPRRAASPVAKDFTKIRKRQAPLKVRAKKKHSRSSIEACHNHEEMDDKPQLDDMPEQKELRNGAGSAASSDSKKNITADFSASNDRATLLGLKFKLNRTQTSIKPEPVPVSTQSEDSHSETEDNVVVVDDQPDKPTESIKKYRFSLGGRNIDDLTSASEEILSSDNNRSPQKTALDDSSHRRIAWSKGIENLIKTTSTDPNAPNKFIKISSSISGVPRKERHGTKLSTAIFPTPSLPDKGQGDKSTRPLSHESAAESADTDDDAVEKRLNSCYADDTYVYPALEDSDYDDEPICRPLKKKKNLANDQAWRPKSKANVATREKRPSRDHAVKASVKAELDRTREYLNDKPSSPVQKTKRSLTKKNNVSTSRNKPDARLDDSSGSSLVMSMPSTSMDHGYHLPPRPTIDTAKPKLKRSGGASTTKQRLGKLLKIHKMF